MGDFTRSLKRAPYLVTETNAQAIGWDAKGQFPPYDGQLRLQAWSHVASGAQMVEYWHWHSLHYGQETYWKGLLGHDLEPNRVYEEAARIGAELRRLGPALAGMMPKNRVAILHSADSHYGLQFMPIDDKVGYLTVEDQLHKALYELNVGADFVFAEEPDLTGYDVLLVPPLYVASDALLEKIADFARAAATCCSRSRAASRTSTTRCARPHAGAVARSLRLLLPGVLEPEGAAAPARAAPSAPPRTTPLSVWAEMILPETAAPLAFYDHPFFGRYPAITRNAWGKGSVTYEGTVVSDSLQRKVVAEVLRQAGVAPVDSGLPPKVRARQLVDRDGRRVHFYLNFSAEPQSFAYPHAASTDLLNGRPVAAGQGLTLAGWDLAVVREERLE